MFMRERERAPVCVCKLTGVIKQKLIVKSYTDTAVTSWTIKYHLKFCAYRGKKTKVVPT